MQLRSHGMFDSKAFWKPFFLTTLLFAAMILALLFVPIRPRRLGRAPCGPTTNIDEEEDADIDEISPPWCAWWPWFSSFLDVFSILLAVQTLCWLPVAVFAALHCTIDLISTGVSLFWFNVRPAVSFGAQHILGWALALGGLALAYLAQAGVAPRKITIHSFPPPLVDLFDKCSDFSDHA